MELQHTEAATEAASTEPVESAASGNKILTDSELRSAIKGTFTLRRVKASLRELDWLMGNLGSGAPKPQLTEPLEFPNAFATRAALELIRRRTWDIEARLCKLQAERHAAHYARRHRQRVADGEEGI